MKREIISILLSCCLSVSFSTFASAEEALADDEIIMENESVSNDIFMDVETDVSPEDKIAENENETAKNEALCDGADEDEEYEKELSETSVSSADEPDGNTYSEDIKNIEDAKNDADGEEFLMTISSETARPGELVTVTVSVQDIFEAAVGSFVLDYDRSMLHFSEVCFGEAISGVSTAVNSDYLIGDKTFLYISFITPQNIILSDQILTITFEVDESAADDTNISVDFERIEVYDQEEAAVPVRGEGGNILSLVYTIGDVNKDNMIDLRDAFRILKYDAGIINFSNSEMMAADVNLDGKQDILDALLIQKHHAGLIKLD